MHTNHTTKEKAEDVLHNQAERIKYLQQRVIELGHKPNEMIILLLNNETPLGNLLAHILMPKGWDTPFKKQGLTPIARGIVPLAAFKSLIDTTPYADLNQDLTPDKLNDPNSTPIFVTIPPNSAVTTYAYQDKKHIPPHILQEIEKNSTH